MLVLILGITCLLSVGDSNIIGWILYHCVPRDITLTFRAQLTVLKVTILLEIRWAIHQIYKTSELSIEETG